MPDPRLQRTRTSLPDGYQFGDISRATRMCVEAGTITDEEALSIMQAAYNEEMARLSHWNVMGSVGDTGGRSDA